jgi:ComF family protein
VNALKFRSRTRLAAPLGRLLGVLLSEGDGEPHQLRVDAVTHIIPVPLHARRRKDRGFDQAELLAFALGEAIDRPVRTGLLVRVRNTRPQIGLGPAERDANVRGAFQLRHPLPTPGVLALLVDDVYTTGATLTACARALRAGKAEAVYAVTVSRAAPKWHPAADLIPDV